jgi:hypothetical protein
MEIDAIEKYVLEKKIRKKVSISDQVSLGTGVSPGLGLRAPPWTWNLDDFPPKGLSQGPKTRVLFALMGIKAHGELLDSSRGAKCCPGAPNEPELELRTWQKPAS